MDTVQDPVARTADIPRPVPPGQQSSTARSSPAGAYRTGAVDSLPPPTGTGASSQQDPPKPTVSKFIEEVRAAFSARFYLLELEAKRAARSAAYMLAFAVGAALLGVTAWLILMGALIVGAVNLGVPWPLAVAVAIALHAGAAFLLLRAIRSMVDNLTFAATRRTLSQKQSHAGQFTADDLSKAQSNPRA